MDNTENVFNLPSEPFEAFYNHGLIEPEVWIEFHRITPSKMIHRARRIYIIDIDDEMVRKQRRQYIETKTGDIVFEWLM